MKLLGIFAILLISAWGAANAQQARYVESRFSNPVGPYFLYGETYFRVKEAHEVSGLGSWGRATGKGWLGFLTVNGFEAHGALPNITSLQTQEAFASGKTVANAALNGDGSASIPAGKVIVDANG